MQFKHFDVHSSEYFFASSLKTQRVAEFFFQFISSTSGTKSGKRNTLKDVKITFIFMILLKKLCENKLYGVIFEAPLEPF